ncbi:hypothetical protein [Actinoplanes sp. NPDC048796]|uniref:hypothetical protein n=1 Tax=unclassified Actinoplanes TaxID=2626549 RepID=UPI0033CB99DC
MQILLCESLIADAGGNRDRALTVARHAELAATSMTDPSMRAGAFARLSRLAAELGNPEQASALAAQG